MTMSAISTSSPTSETYFDPTPLIPGWTNRPIPSFTLSAAGLLVLADLSTVAQRTALRGGSSWFDSLLLVPGLHYQQAADELARSEGATILVAAEDPGRDGTIVRHQIVNQAVVNYVLRVAKEGETVLLDVGDVPSKSRTRGGGRSQRSMLYAGGQPEHGQELSWAAHLLYLASPALTCVAIVLIILISDWWALALVLTLMTSRLLNIFVIKARSRPKPTTLPSPFTQLYSGASIPRITQYTITLNPTTRVILRGLSTDLYALTTTIWLRPKTHAEGYLEAIAKVLVYLVASVSGNATQAGNLILLALLLASAGLLALSNARVTGLRNGGKVVAPPSSGEEEKKQPSGGRRKDSGAGGRPHHGARKHHSEVDSPKGPVVGKPGQRYPPTLTPEPDLWQETSDSSSMAGMEDITESRRARNVHTRTYHLNDSVEYEVRLEEGLRKTPTTHASSKRHR